MFKTANYPLFRETVAKHIFLDPSFAYYVILNFVSCCLGAKKFNKRAPGTPGELARLWISETLKIQVCVYFVFFHGENCQDPSPIPAHEWPM